jgi:integrase
MANTVKGLYKRGRIWWMRYARPDGRIIYESTGKTTFRDAQYVLACRRKEVTEGKFPETRRIKNHSFEELALIYDQWVQNQRSYKTSRKYVIKHLKEVFGTTALGTFTTRMVEQYQSERLKERKPATVNRTLAILKHMFTKAVEWEMVHEQVLVKVRRVKQLLENNRRLRFLSVEECQQLIHSCDPHLRPIVIMAFNTGMRRGEILGLTWDQVDLKHGFILLEVTKNGERKEIPINGMLRTTLQGLTRHIDSPYVFWQGENGNRYKAVTRSFKTACTKAGIKDFHFHDLRHTFYHGKGAARPQKHHHDPALCPPGTVPQGKSGRYSRPAVGR